MGLLKKKNSLTSAAFYTALQRMFGFHKRHLEKQKVQSGLCYSGCSFSSMSDTRMFFSVCSARLELVRL